MVVSAPNTVLVKPLTQQVLSRRDQIPPQTDLLWRIERGVVRTLSWSEEGTQIILGYWGPGDIVGYPLSKLSPYVIECLTSVEIRILPEALWVQALDAIVLHIQQIEKLLSIVHRNPISLRLWQLLGWLAHKFGRDVEQGRLIDLEITQQELAEAINTTRVTVTRLLQQFELEGRLRRQHRQLVLVVL